MHDAVICPDTTEKIKETCKCGGDACEVGKVCNKNGECTGGAFLFCCRQVQRYMWWHVWSILIWFCARPSLVRWLTGANPIFEAFSEICFCVRSIPLPLQHFLSCFRNHYSTAVSSPFHSTVPDLTLSDKIRLPGISLLLFGVFDLRQRCHVSAHFSDHFCCLQMIPPVRRQSQSQVKYSHQSTTNSNFTHQRKRTALSIDLDSNIAGSVHKEQRWRRFRGIRDYRGI